MSRVPYPRVSLRTSVALAAMAAIVLVLAAAPAGASAPVVLDGSFSSTYVKPDWTGSTCPAGVQGDECGVIELASLGPADWVYAFGPTFEPNGRCFDVDGTFKLTLRSDGSAITGPLTGVFCPRPSESGHEHRGAKSWGNPFVEDDSIVFTDGTGQFAGLHGTATLHTQFAGANLRGTLTGTLGS